MRINPSQGGNFNQPLDPQQEALNTLQQLSHTNWNDQRYMILLNKLVNQLRNLGPEFASDLKIAGDHFNNRTALTLGDYDQIGRDLGQ